MNENDTAIEATEYNFRFDEAGRIHVRNLSAYWIPELTVTEEIGGTVYTVTGSYEGRRVSSTDWSVLPPKISRREWRRAR